MSNEQNNGAENSQNASNIEAIDLTPIHVTDNSLLAKYWESIHIDNKDYKAGIQGSTDFTSKGKLEDISFNKIPEAKIALRMLGDSQYKNLIKVDALAFPAINCVISTEKDLKWYEEHLYKKGEHEEFIPLVEKREGYGDPWTDGKFPPEAKFGSKEDSSIILPETCVEVDCPDCKGYGYLLKSKTVNDGHHSIKCPRCLGSGRENGKPCGRCRGDGWIRENDYKIEKDKITCERCLGSGRLRSVLEAHRIINKSSSKNILFMGIPDSTIPEAVREIFWMQWTFLGTSDVADYKSLSKVESTAGRYKLTDEDIPNVGPHKDALKKKIVEEQAKLDDKRARIKHEQLEFRYGIRFVRFHFKYYIGAMDWNVDDRMVVFEDNAALGKIDHGYFKRQQSHMIEMTIWLDTLSGRVWGSFPKAPGYTQKDPAQYCDPRVGMLALLVAMGRAANGGKKMSMPNAGKTITSAKSSKGSAAKKPSAQSQKKRWKFIILGLLFGWMGAHYLYAKRMFLLLLLWASFITGVAMIGSSQGDEKQPAQDATAEVAKKSNTNEAIGGGCIALWALLWLGGTFFVKKDGKGNRM